MQRAGIFSWATMAGYSPTFFGESGKTNSASIAHLSAPLALSDLMPQVGQRDVGAKLRGQILFAVMVRIGPLLTQVKAISASSGFDRSSHPNEPKLQGGIQCGYLQWRH
jgi:hypothetical protein